MLPNWIIARTACVVAAQVPDTKSTGVDGLRRSAAGRLAVLDLRDGRPVLKALWRDEGVASPVFFGAIPYAIPTAQSDGRIAISGDWCQRPTACGARVGTFKAGSVARSPRTSVNP
jgi:hypothetical protein